MKLGIVGLPNVGKSTLFNAITNAGAESANYPFCTIDPNVGMVAVPDARLDRLSEMYHPKKTTPAVIEFVDIAGLVKGASRGEGLGNKFLGNIRATDAIVHVVRCFDDDNVIHVEGATDPIRDIDTIDLELVMADLEMVERRIDKAKKAAKGDKKFLQEAADFEGLRDWLNDGKSARSYTQVDISAEYPDCELLSLKPVIYAANLDEDGFSAPSAVPYYAQVEQRAGAGLILWTCREGQILQDAIAACEGWGLTFDSINESLPDWIEAFGTQPRKVGATEYWDDKAVRIPDTLPPNTPLAQHALDMVRGERERQYTLWGDQSGNSLFEWISILGEEYGELCEAVNETSFSNAAHPDRGGFENVVKEAIQVAAVAVAIIETAYRRKPEEVSEK